MASNWNDIFSVKGITVLITGGGGVGIGRMLSEGFVAAGAHVIISSRNASELARTAEALNSQGPGTCRFVVADLAKLSDVDRLANELSTELKVEQLHCVIHNSGTFKRVRLLSYTEQDWDDVMGLNVKTVFFLTKALIPLLRKTATPQDPARVITIGSVSGFSQGLPGAYSYDTSKAALHHLSRRLAADLSSSHITVNAIAAGNFPSLLMDTLPKPLRDAMHQSVPLGRIGNAQDIAGAAIFLSSRAGAWVTGQILAVDGGASNHPTMPSKL